MSSISKLLESIRTKNGNNLKLLEDYHWISELMKYARSSRGYDEIDMRFNLKDTGVDYESIRVIEKMEGSYTSPSTRQAYDGYIKVTVDPFKSYDELQKEIVNSLDQQVA